MKVKAIEYFADGNILGAPVDVGQVVEVSRREYELLLQSGGRFEVQPDNAEVTPVEALKPAVPVGSNPPLTKEQFEAKQLKEKQEFEAKQKAEKERFDADVKAFENQPEFKLNLTDNGQEQATHAEEEAVAKKVAEKEGKERQALADKAVQEARSEVKKGDVEKAKAKNVPNR